MPTSRNVAQCKLVALKFEISSPTYQEKGSYWISVTTFFCHHVDLDLCPVDKIQSNVSFSYIDAFIRSRGDTPGQIA